MATANVVSEQTSPGGGANPPTWVKHAQPVDRAGRCAPCKAVRHMRGDGYS